MSENSEITTLLKQKEEGQKQLPTSIKITKNALAKARKIGSFVDIKSYTSNEWYAFPLARKGDDNYIIRDVILPKDQEISSAYVTVSGQDVALAANEVKEINQNNGFDSYIIGWLHSHGSMQPFHSATDDNNIMDVLNSVSLNTEIITSYKNFNLIESEPIIEKSNGNVLIKGHDAEDGIMELTIDDKDIESLLTKYNMNPNQENKDFLRKIFQDAINPKNISFKEPLITGFCYSIVINNKGANPYTLMAVIEEEVISYKKKKYKKNVPLEIIEVNDDIEINEQELQKLVDERIKVPRFWGIFGTDKKEKGGKKKNKFGFQQGFGYGYGYNYGGYAEHYPKQIEIEEVNKNKIEKPSLKNLVNKFVDRIFEYAFYNRHEDYSQYLDKVITGIIKTKDVEKTLINSGEPYEISFSDDFVPEILGPYRETTKKILLKYVENKTENSQKLVEIMGDFVETRYSYAKGKAIENIGELVNNLEDNIEVKEIIKEQKEIIKKNYNQKKNVTKKTKPDVRYHDPKSKTDDMPNHLL